MERGRNGEEERGEIEKRKGRGRKVVGEGEREEGGKGPKGEREGEENCRKGAEKAEGG